ncbi:MAG TPA: hypothetical protein VK543_09215 [Puia sp.]|nr:hypothetical protein [Puia sp.]
MNRDISDQFLFTSKQNYLDCITPANPSSRLEEGYRKIVKIAEEYFKNNEYKEFAEFFQEGQYFIPLWTAHMIVEYGNPSNKIMKSAISVILEYADSPFATEVAKEEKQWLKDYGAKYNINM